jgi:hypothetical protein
MYITGTQYDFASRMHELADMNVPTGTLVASGLDSINSFLIEGRTYINSGFVTQQESGRWEKEARLIRYMLSGDANILTGQLF